MKKRRKTILLALAYAVVLIGLLALQSLTMEGSMTKLAANVATLILVIPSIFLFKTHIRLKEQEEKIKERETLEKGEKSPEQQQREFFEQMEQSGLSAREQEVAWLLYKGYRNLQIAEELYISETTVKKHVSHIYEKTEVSGRKEFREKYNDCK